MLPIIVTDRLKLLPCTLEEPDRLCGLWMYPGIREFLFSENDISRDKLAGLIAGDIARAGERNVGFWTIEANDDPAAIGFCGFRPMEDKTKIELLYGLKPEYQGRGLAMEAVTASLEYVWTATDFQGVYARSEASNVKSLELIHRLGMRLHKTGSDRMVFRLDRPA